MSLEDKVNSSSMEKLRNFARKKYVTAVLTLASFFTPLAAGCGGGGGGNGGNRPPETSIQQLLINQNDVSVEVKGTDDGYIEGFYVKLDNQNEQYIPDAGNDGVETLVYNDLAEGSHNIKAAAVDNNGLQDETPAEEYFAIEQQPIVGSGTTNQQGNVTFLDNSTNIPVTIRVTDKQGSPLENILVGYYDGNGFERFVAIDPLNVYSPSMFIETAVNRTRQVSHTLELGQMPGPNLITIHDEDITKGIISYQDSMGAVTTVTYVRTIGADEYWQMIEDTAYLIDLIAATAGAVFGGGVLDALLEPGALYEAASGGPPPEETRFDIYKNVETLPQTETNYINWEIRVSNPPKIDYAEANVNGNDLVASWDGSDKIAYDTPVAGLMQEDPTRFFGPTIEFDKMFLYRVYKEGETPGEFQETAARGITMLDLAPGNYNLELRVRDEVENLSAINRVPFSILQPGQPLIAFVSDRDGNNEVYVMNPDGTSPRNLTNNSADDSYPSWSPDRSKIAFASNRGGNYDIWIMNADGSNPAKLTTHSYTDRAPTWSPDGQYIAFETSRDSQWEIYKIRIVDGESSATNLSNNSSEDRWPDWWGLGDYIAFARQISGYNYDIFKMDSNGSGQQNLTDNNLDADSTPDWSPDGDYIVFVSKRNGSTNQIYMMNANGSNQNPVTNDSYDNRYPAFSPDGLKIIFARIISGKFDIYGMDNNGSNQQNLTNTPNSNDILPDW